MREGGDLLKVDEELGSEDREALPQGQQGYGVQFEQQQVPESGEHATNTASTGGGERVGGMRGVVMGGASTALRLTCGPCH